MKIGFLVNPIAGMGGRVGLKGTDGELVKLAIKLGAKPVSPTRADRFLKHLTKLGLYNLEFYSPSGIMGSDYLQKYGLKHKIILDVDVNTSVEDTKNACKRFLEENINLIVFVGGDGTARDIYDVVKLKIPVLAIPSGVKMYSSIFAINPEAAAELLKKHVDGETTIVEREVLDIDEEAYRRDELKIKLYGYLKVPIYEKLIQSGKIVVSSLDVEENKRAIAKYVIEKMENDVLYILGPGTTVKSIADMLGIEKTLLGVDAIYNKRLVGKDLSEQEILKLIEKYKRVKIIVSPLGGEGFLFGRGNQQISPEVLLKVGKENIIVVATRDKIQGIRELYVDSGDLKVDNMFRGYIRVIIDYREEKVMRIS